MENNMTIMYFVVALAIILVVAIILCLVTIRNSQVYQIRMAILHDPDYDIMQAIGNHNKLPSYDCMVVNPTQWHMWTVGQYYRRYVLNNNS